MLPPPAPRARSPQIAGALGRVRVLDLSGPSGNFGVKLLADLGADVIKVEPPEGDPVRHRGPFAGRLPHPERSLEFLFLNTNKRGITLNLDTRAGQQIFRRLAAKADVIVETSRPGWMAERGVGYTVLRTLNASLIYTAITPYGQTGPYAQFKGTELSGEAMGGALALTGEAGERPVRGACRVGDKMSGYIAATATTIALYHRTCTGVGQLVDISVQEAVLSQMEGTAGTYAFSGRLRYRSGTRYPATTCPAGLFPCADGWAAIVAARPHQWIPLRDWIGDPRLDRPEWLSDPKRFEERDVIDPLVTEWTRTIPKQTLFYRGQQLGIPIGESNTPAEVVRDVHLRATGYFVKAEHPLIGEFEMPGSPWHLSATPWRFSRPAPQLGQHNEEILREVGVTAEELPRLREQGVV